MNKKIKIKLVNVTITSENLKELVEYVDSIPANIDVELEIEGRLQDGKEEVSEPKVLYPADLALYKTVPPSTFPLGKSEIEGILKQYKPTEDDTIHY